LFLSGFFARHIVKGKLFFGRVHAERACCYFLYAPSRRGVMLVDLLSPSYKIKIIELTMVCCGQGSDAYNHLNVVACHFFS
jgi:hypothetical protein